MDTDRIGLSWDLYRSFLAVMRGGSLLAAAKSLNTSQPTIGRHISSLEHKLGSSLFIRSGAGLLPTPLALDVRGHAEEMEKANFHIHNIISSAKEEVAGRVRIRASEFVGGILMQKTIAAISQLYPRLTIELMLGSTIEDPPVQTTDIGVRMIRPQLGYATSQQIGVLEYGLYAHKSYVSRRGLPESPSQLEDHRYIGFNKIDFGAIVLKKLGIHLPLEWFSVRTDSEFAQIGAIRAGTGIGTCCVKYAGNDPDLVRVLPETVRMPLEMWILLPNSLRSGGPVSIVYDELVKRLTAVVQGEDAL